MPGGACTAPFGTHPTWSPDGKWLLFWSQRESSTGNENRLHRIRSTGGMETVVLGYDIEGLYRGPYDPDWRWVDPAP